jgi:hypothetical protein
MCDLVEESKNDQVKPKKMFAQRYAKELRITENVRVLEREIEKLNLPKIRYNRISRRHHDVRNLKLLFRVQNRNLADVPRL